MKDINKEEVIEETVDTQEEVVVLEEAPKKKAAKTKSKTKPTEVKEEVDTKATSSEPTVEDKGRQEKMLKMFKYLKRTKRNLDLDEVEFVQKIGRQLSTEERYKLGDIYTQVYGIKVRHCLCPAMYKQFIDRLKMQIEYQELEG